MHKNSNENIKHLHNRIKSLEEENLFLAERAEETLLLRLAAESINSASTNDELIENVLEKISVLKDIPFCSCFALENNKSNYIQSYLSFNEKLPDNFSVALNQDLKYELDQGPAKVKQPFTQNGLTLQGLPSNFKPFSAVLIPFSTRTISSGIFFFMDDEKNKQKLSSVIILLQNIIDLVSQRLDKIQLIEELQTVNAALEHKIQNRTKQLKISNQKLSEEIIERKKILVALQESEERFRELFNNAGDAIYLWDLNPDGTVGKCLEVNDVASAMTGYSREELLHFTPKDLNNEVSREKLPDIIKKLLNTGTSTFSATHVTKDRKEIPVEVSSHVFKLRNKPVILSITRDVTEREKAQSALRESEEKYRLLFSAERDAIVIMEIGTNKIIDANDSALKLYGYSRDEMIQMNALNLSADIEISKTHIAKVAGMDKPKIAQQKNLHRKKDGTIFPVEASSGKFELRGKEMIYVVFRDISERVRAEETLRKSEQKFKKLVADLPDAIFLTRIGGKNPGEILEVNQAAEFQTGYSRDELIGKNIVKDLSLLKDNVDNLEEGEKKLINGEIIKFTESKVRKDGSEYITEVLISAVLLEDEMVALSVNRDITKQKEIENEMNKLSRSVEQSPVSIVITDVTGAIEYVNPKFTEVTGYSLQEAIGENPRILKSDEKKSSDYEDLWETITAGKEWQGEFHNKRKNGELYWEYASISPIKSEADEITHFLAVKEDISERKRLQQQLIQAQKMETVGTLAGGIAHDFNNLLTVINGHAEIALMKLEKEHIAHRDMISIMHAGKKAENLTRQLLAFSRKQIYETKIININEVITGLDKMLRRLIGEDIQITCNLYQDIPHIKADPSQLEQILMNLVVNARDALNEKTTNNADRSIIIETKEVKIDTVLKTQHPEIQGDNMLLLSISDTGIGIPKQIQEKIFEPFFTTKDKGKGTGLGLSTVYGIVKQNQGFIYVSSDEESGTTFNIYWPVSLEKIEKNIPEHTDRQALEGNETILFVEDDEGIRELISDALREFGYQVYEAENGRTAMKILSDIKGEIRLLITDLIMPKMNGKELVKQVKKNHHSDIKVIFTSGYTDAHIVSKGKLDHGINFIPKPYSVNTIALKIRQVLNQ